MESNKKFMTYFIEEVINNKNLELTNQLVEEDFIEHIPFPGQGPGRAGLVDVLSSMFHAFPDMHWTILEQVAEGDHVVTRFSWTGTHQGDFMGIPSTGNKVEVWGIVMDVVRNNKFAESRILMDTMSLLQQLGAIQ